MILHKNRVIGLIVGLAVFLGALIASGRLSSQRNLASNQSTQTLPNNPIQAEISKPQLEVEDLQVGDGAVVPEKDKYITIHLVGKREDGTVIINTVADNKPLTVLIGDAKLVRGLDKGIPGMRVGGKRRITIPPDLAYAKKGISRLVPPDEMLIFEVELLAITAR